MARTRGRRLPWRSAAERRRGRRRCSTASGIGDLAAPPHPRAVGRPAAAGVHRPRPARRARPAADGRADVGRRRAHPPRGAPPARRPARRRAGDRAHDPRPQRDRRPPAAPRVPQHDGDRRCGTPREVLTPRRPRAHLRRPDGGARARRDAGRDRPLHRPTSSPVRRRERRRDGRAARARTSSSSSATA